MKDAFGQELQIGDTVLFSPSNKNIAVGRLRVMPNPAHTGYGRPYVQIKYVKFTSKWMPAPHGYTNHKAIFSTYKLPVGIRENMEDLNSSYLSTKLIKIHPAVVVIDDLVPVGSYAVETVLRSRPSDGDNRNKINNLKQIYRAKVLELLNEQINP